MILKSLAFLYLVFVYSLFAYCNNDSLVLDSNISNFIEITEVINNNPIYKEKRYQTEASDEFIDSMFANPEFAILVANALFDKKYIIIDSGDYFYVDDRSGTTGQMYQVEADYNKNELLYLMYGKQDGLFTFWAKLVMRVSYCDNDTGSVIYPFFYIHIDNYMLRKMAGFFLKLPLLHTIIDRRIEKEILLVKKLGINLILELKKPDTFDKLSEKLTHKDLTRLKRMW